MLTEMIGSLVSTALVLIIILYIRARIYRTNQPTLCIILGSGGHTG